MFSTKYTVVYVELLMVCFIFVSVMLSKVSRDLGTKNEVRAFKWMLRIFLVMMVLDSITQIHHARLIQPSLTAISLVYATYMFLIGLMSLTWLAFAELQINERVIQDPRFIAFCAALAVLFAIPCYGTLVTGWMFSFDADGVFQRGPFFVICNALSYTGVIIATIRSLYASMRTTAPSRKRRMRMLASFMLAPLIGALLQWLIGGYPMVGPCLCIGIMFVFVSLQNDMIHLDALTGLNNRKSLDRYLEEIRPHASELKPYYLFIVDADEFKKVNDRLGHIEGDRALRRIADALRMTGDAFYGFIARFGGDEFVAVTENSYLKDPEDFVKAMSDNLKSICEKHKIEYPLTVSIGYTRIASPSMHTGKILSAADQMLYAKKKEKT